MKKIWAGVLAAAVLLLTACSAEEAAMRKKFFTRNDKAIANERFEALIDAIQARDGDAVRALFSKNVLRETGNLEDAIPALFDYFQGKMLSYDDWGAMSTHAKKNDGEYWKSYDCTYDLETTQDKYRLAMEFITVDTADKDNAGIRSLYIIRFADDTDQERAYRGDGNDTPGINIGKS